MLLQRLPPRHGQLLFPRGFNHVLVRFKSVSSPNSFDIAEIEPSAIYVSRSTNPVWNLSFEDLLFRRTPQDNPLLLIYRNEPCVIIGRNQNPWKEINLTALKKAGIPFVRRRSGGGTVYHDLGNTNFSLHLPRSAFERKKGSALALDALKRLNVPEVWVNHRNDVCAGTFKMSTMRKPVFCVLRGSAYKIINTRAYHHGTMLIDAKLGQLGDVLRNEKDTMIGRSVASVRSPVRNINALQPSVTHESFSEALIQAFVSTFKAEDKVAVVDEGDLKGNDFIEKSNTDLETWNWKYGQTLEFIYHLKGKVQGRTIRADIEAKHGLITNCTIRLGDTTETEQIPLGEMLTGMRYGFLDVNQWQDEDREIIEWLQREM